MQSVVKYFISLLFALLFNLIPGQFALDEYQESRTPGVLEVPAALCREDVSLPEENHHPATLGESEFQFYSISSCS